MSGSLLREIGKAGRPAIKAGPFGSAIKKQDYVPSGYKVYGQEQVISGDENIGSYFISESHFQKLKSCEVRRGDILISLVGTVGKTIIISENAAPGVINPRLIRISPDLERFNPKFVDYFLASASTQKQLKRLSQGGTMDVVNAGSLGELRIPDLPLSEQDEIIEILSDCDAAIGFAEQVTANAKRKHTALVHHFMRAFSNQQVPIDQLDLQLIVDGDWVESKDQDPKGEIRLVQTGNVGDGRFIDASSRYMTDAKAKELGCTFLQPGDILISRLPDPIGRACILPDLGQPCVTAVDVCIIRPGNTINNVWLLNAINWKKTRAQMQARAGGSTRQRVSTSEIKKIRLPLVTAEISEQCGRSLSLLQQEIQLQQKRSTLLKQHKRGLMQQLLTGKLRVKGAA